MSRWKCENLPEFSLKIVITLTDTLTSHMRDHSLALTLSFRRWKAVSLFRIASPLATSSPSTQPFSSSYNQTPNPSLQVLSRVSSNTKRNYSMKVAHRPPRHQPRRCYCRLLIPKRCIPPSPRPFEGWVWTRF